MTKTVVLLMMMWVGAFAQAQSQDIATIFRLELAKMPLAEQARLEGQLRQVIDQTKRLNLLQNVATTSAAGWQPVVCLGMRAGFFLAGRGALCVTWGGERFLIHIVGIEPYVGVSGDIAVGMIEGGPADGAYPMNFSASAHFKVGGSALVAGPLVLFGVGLGFDIGMNGGIPARPNDSPWAGQLHIRRSN